MDTHNRRKTFFHLTLIVIGMILLEASLSELEFQLGMPTPGTETSQKPTIAVNEYDIPGIKLCLLIQGLLVLIIRIKGARNEKESHHDRESGMSNS